MKREKMKKNLSQTEQTLRNLVYGDDKSMKVNVMYGMLGSRKYFLQLTKQMTLDAYVEDDTDAIVSFPVLDVTVNRRAFMPESTFGWRGISPEGLAVMIHKSARKLPHYEIK